MNSPTANVQYSHLGAPWSARSAALRPVNQVKKDERIEACDEVGGKRGSQVPPFETCSGFVPVERVGL